MNKSTTDNFDGKWKTKSKYIQIDSQGNESEVQNAEVDVVFKRIDKNFFTRTNADDTKPISVGVIKPYYDYFGKIKGFTLMENGDTVLKNTEDKANFSQVIIPIKWDKNGNPIKMVSQYKGTLDYKDGKQLWRVGDVVYDKI
jgi:hypothetical protein